MEKVDRLMRAYQHLRDCGMAHKQKDVAEKMNTAASNVSKAFKGEERYLTEGFLRKFNKVFGEKFSYNWLLNGEGEMLAQDLPGTKEEKEVKLNILNTPIAMKPNKSGYTIVTPIPIGAANKSKPTREMVKRLRLAVPDSANMRASVVMQHLFDSHPNTALWIATGKDNIVAMDKLEVEALKGQLQALKMLNESLMKENEAIRAKIDAERKLL